MAHRPGPPLAALPPTIPAREYGHPCPSVASVKDGETTVATYRYDALGRRVEKDVEEGVFERYVYAGFETIATYGASNAWKQDFVFGQGIDQVLMLEQADVLDADEDENTSETTRSFYHRNALGSVMAITELDEDVAVSYRYDPYGAVTITRGGQTQQTDPLGQHWTFTARFYDQETALVFYRARFVVPGLGRFVEFDPADLEAGPNLYEYARSSPAMFTDPTGEVVFMGPFALGFGIGLIASLIANEIDEECEDDLCECSLQISADVKAEARANKAASVVLEQDSILLIFSPAGPPDCDEDCDCEEVCRGWFTTVEVRVAAYTATGGKGARPTLVADTAARAGSGGGVRAMRLRHVWWGKTGYDRSDPVETYPHDDADAIWDPDTHANWKATHFESVCRD